MVLLEYWIKRLYRLGIVSLLAVSSFAEAGALRVSPTTIDISAQDRAATVTLYNMSDEIATLQIRVFKWTLNEGKDLLTETNDIVVSPPFITLAAGGSFNFRVVRSTTDNIIEEKSYRIIIDEIPKPQDKRSVGTGIDILIRNSLPLFIVNTTAVARVNSSISINGLMMKNDGNRHALLSDVEVTDINNKKKTTLDINTVNGYLLEKSSRIYPLPKGFYIPGNRYQVSFKANRLPETTILQQ